MREIKLAISKNIVSKAKKIVEDSLDYMWGGKFKW
jgi:hypothetical protein